MLIFYKELGESLRKGFIDQKALSKKEYLPQFLVNDGENGRKVLSTLLHQLNDCDEFWFSVAFVTTSGVATLINTLKELEAKNIRGKILVSQYQNFTQPEALRSLCKLANVELKIAVEGKFHAKGYLFKKYDTYTLIVGSSNLTQGALCVNKEWNLKISSSNNGTLIAEAINEFTNEFARAVKVDEGFINCYEEIYQQQKAIHTTQQIAIEKLKVVTPNSMQEEALKNLRSLREKNIKKALLISATGTGKTYLSAFDVLNVNPKRLLFIVHRANIAKAAMDSFRLIFRNQRTMGMYSGERKEISCEFLFSTVQTISQDHHLSQFSSDHFDYIVIDETHRAGAPSYQQIMSHFQPKFLLGMTATPERTDGFDIFKQFDHNIAYEIRLHRALKEEMLCPFHYYGVTDVSINEEVVNEDAAFNLLIAKERVDRIIEKVKLYKCDNGRIRGLVFCSKVAEAKALANDLNERGFSTVALCGDDSEEDRDKAIKRLESDNEADRLDYIFTVDIFNEGIDIPRVNQIIMLRPTQSAIIFVQQLGRGLRKTFDKEYLTVIDFIGNYSNNYLVPIALYGNTSYNKDELRKLLVSGSNLIPGASTVNFEMIARERIFAAIDSANMSRKKDLLNAYQLLKFEIGRMPMMVDFLEHGSRDPFQYVQSYDSYFNFVSSEEDSLKGVLSKKHMEMLELFSCNISNAKRIDEVIIINELIAIGKLSFANIKKLMFKKYQVSPSDETIISSLRNLNFEFIKSPQDVVVLDGDIITLHEHFIVLLQNKHFLDFLADTLEYAIRTYDLSFQKSEYIGGFLLYNKYSRKDVCRILNWQVEEASTMYGYKVKHGTCPIFVNYHKEEAITSSTKYEDKFLSTSQFQWNSRSRRTLESNEIKAIINSDGNLRLPLFVKKDNDEGADFYYMGDLKYQSCCQRSMVDDQQKQVPVVEFIFDLSHSVDDLIYKYITTASGDD